MHNYYYEEKFRQACRQLMLPVDDVRDAFGLASHSCSLAFNTTPPEIDDDHWDAFERFKEMHKGKGVREMDTGELEEFSSLLHELAFYFSNQATEQRYREDHPAR